MTSIVVLGSGLAGLRAAEVLREKNFQGKITLVGAEPQLPYNRPPLSKQFLAGEWDEGRVRFHLGKPKVCLVKHHILFVVGLSTHLQDGGANAGLVHLVLTLDAQSDDDDVGHDCDHDCPVEDAQITIADPHDLVGLVAVWREERGIRTLIAILASV